MAYTNYEVTLDGWKISLECREERADLELRLASLAEHQVT